MKIAAVGCLHGELDLVYQEIADIEKNQNINVDLVLVCGDFQTVRNLNDLKCMSIPEKYRRLGTFHQYYFGEKIAPKLTLLIGGNHEASNYLQTLPYGGWVAPNMYYLGYCSVLRFGRLRIGGLSGIFKSHDAKLGHYECLPYDNNARYSIYHMRESDVYKILQLSNYNNQTSDQLVDIFMSHDWPINIHQCSSQKGLSYLLRKKPHFRREVEENRFGNALLQPVVNHLRPRFWFAAHMHIGFNVTILHRKTEEGREVKTEFQALDKILPRRQYLRIVDVDGDDQQEMKNDTESFRESLTNKLEYDPEWLAILRKTDHLLSVSRQPIHNLNIFTDANKIEITSQDIEEVKELFNKNFQVPKNFQKCEPVLDSSTDSDPNREKNFVNFQTKVFCERLKIRDPNESFSNRSQLYASTNQSSLKVVNPDEIDLSDSEDEDNDDKSAKKKCKIITKNDHDNDDEKFGFIIDTKGEPINI